MLGESSTIELHPQLGYHEEKRASPKDFQGPHLSALLGLGPAQSCILEAGAQGATI